MQRKIGSYTKQSLQFWWSKFSILIVWETFDQRLCVYDFFDLHFFWIFTREMFSIKLPCNVDDLINIFKSYLKNIEMYWCSFWTLNVCHYVLMVPAIFLPMVTLWQPLKNKNLLRTNRNQPELGKTTLKYTNLFSLISKILGFYIWVFTVFVRHFTR